ncbi:DUF4911 domain-containing protein [Dissulfurirhabdus thermomarina]|uniref:DUF4911 domain-containing protein n=1 Tax=Dissulfurirhabdus thermomarina TaxID=1765737 RepID=A0A6N9TUF0_DISTH|nr:DUF4911 domain-containing protein [Dissulfurirhabdus thermomarina]NDY42126.1 DUF4911 domain-containing protein [Dissulfurirhabdus thermomarina]NMX23137.1 DUF4911 domain-containing protein [Dissulfurirhabdus thermomarina]
MGQTLPAAPGAVNAAPPARRPSASGLFRLSCGMDEGERLQLRIHPGAVHLLRFLLEGYDNLFFLRTLDPGAGRVEVTVTAGSREILRDVLRAHRGRLRPRPEGA